MRPSSYFELSAESQWATDESLGILDWDGSGANGPMTPSERERFEAHYDYFKKKKVAIEKRTQASINKKALEMIATHAGTEGYEDGVPVEYDAYWAACEAKRALNGMPAPKATKKLNGSIQACVEIESDNDFDVLSPIGTFNAYGPELKHKIMATSEDELRRELVWFLSQLEIREPGEVEYDAYKSTYGNSSGHDTSFKMMIYEAIHQIASGGDFEFHRGGNRELHIGLV